MTTAMAYRHQNGVDHNAVAMAVVAQQMVPSDVSGIMFTANPATGERSELIINASFGLGEAVVSGLVTPDTYVYVHMPSDQPIRSCLLWTNFDRLLVVTASIVRQVRS